MKRLSIFVIALLALSTWIYAQANKQVGVGGINLKQLTAGPTAHTHSHGSVEIQWTTAVPGDSNVMWGTTPGAMNQLAQGKGDTKEHKVTIKGLTKGQQYFFAARTTQTGKASNVIQSNTSGFVAK